MIVEFPQAEKCCMVLDLRVGVIAIIVLRVIVFILIILLGVNVIDFGDSWQDGKGWKNEWPEQCYNLYHQKNVELVIVVVTLVLFTLWLIIMIPAIIWDILNIILLGAVLEIIICIWFFFMFSYHVTMALLRGHPSFLLLWSVVLLVAELYALWIIWSYYVDMKADIYGYRASVSTEGDPETEDDRDAE